MDKSHNWSSQEDEKTSISPSKQIETANRFAVLTNLQEQTETDSSIGSNGTRALKAKENGNRAQNKRKIISLGDSHAQGCVERLIYLSSGKFVCGNRLCETKC
jgi:hypothetical protein